MFATEGATRVDALEELRQMHVGAKAAFQDIAGADPGERGALWGKLVEDLQLHEQIEERYVYDPVAKEAGPTDPVLAAWEGQHESDVRTADALIAKIRVLKPASDAWLELVATLRATLEVHIAHEERDIWPRIRTAWGNDKLEAAGWSIAAAKAAAKDGATVAAAIKKADEAAKASARNA
jgi:Hemerythrin HHE cation binding domain